MEMKKTIMTITETMGYKLISLPEEEWAVCRPPHFLSRTNTHYNQGYSPQLISQTK